jgi:hypothetical protein
LTALSAAPKAGNYVMAEELVLDEGAHGRVTHLNLVSVCP